MLCIEETGSQRQESTYPTGLPSVAWTVCCLASPGLAQWTHPGGQTMETEEVLTDETSGSVLVSVAVMGKLQIQGLKTEMCLPPGLEARF